MSEQFVVDTSALLQAYVTDVYTPQIQALLARLAQTDPPVLHFLDIGLAEGTNVLWKRVRFSGVAPEQARTALRDLLTLPIIIHESQALLPDALSIGLDQELAIYDSLYVALARELNIPLITTDSKQQKAALQVAVSIKPITDFVPAS